MLISDQDHPPPRSGCVLGFKQAQIRQRVKRCALRRRLLARPLAAPDNARPDENFNLVDFRVIRAGFMNDDIARNVQPARLKNFLKLAFRIFAFTVGDNIVERFGPSRGLRESAATIR